MLVLICRRNRDQNGLLASHGSLSQQVGVRDRGFVDSVCLDFDFVGPIEVKWHKDLQPRVKEIVDLLARDRW